MPVVAMPVNWVTTLFNLSSDAYTAKVSNVYAPLLIQPTYFSFYHNGGYRGISYYMCVLNNLARHHTLVQFFYPEYPTENIRVFITNRAIRNFMLLN